MIEMSSLHDELHASVFVQSVVQENVRTKSGEVRHCITVLFQLKKMAAGSPGQELFCRL
jgi:hypothetical protein